MMYVSRNLTELLCGHFLVITLANVTPFQPNLEGAGDAVEWVHRASQLSWASVTSMAATGTVPSQSTH